MPYDLNIVLIEPQIPQNTGSIGRLCLATGTTLHLVHPLGFEITHSRLKRAGLDYWEHLKVVEHANAEAFLASVPPGAQKVFFSKKAGHTLYDHKFEKGAYLILGHEVTGIPEWIINRYPTDTTRVPMYDARVRSLNLANVASIAVYEAIRQLGP
jgi:tRNA (cytidine/uridine-2'-O-)-methyltransferase